MSSSSLTIKWADPKAIADADVWYAVDCGAFLAGDPLASVVWTLPEESALELTDQAETTTQAQIQLSGGAAGDWRLIMRITTAGGQTFERGVVLRVSE